MKQGLTFVEIPVDSGWSKPRLSVLAIKFGEIWDKFAVSFLF